MSIKLLKAAPIGIAALLIAGCTPVQTPEEPAPAPQTVAPARQVVQTAVVPTPTQAPAAPTPTEPPASKWNHGPQGVDGVSDGDEDGGWG